MARKTTRRKKTSCWSGYKAEGKKNSPSGKKNPDGTPKKVNNCVKIRKNKKKK